MKVHFHYEALNSREQQVARFWDGHFGPSPWTASAARPFCCLQFVRAVHISHPRRPTHFPETTRQFWSRILLTRWTRQPRKRRRACLGRYTHPVRKGTPPPSSCGTLLLGLPSIAILAECPYSTAEATTQVRWAAPLESGTTGSSQTGEMSPTVPHPWRCGTPLTSASPHSSTCLAPPL